MNKFIGLLLGASLLSLAAPSVFERYRSRAEAPQVEAIPAAPPVLSASASPRQSTGSSVSIPAGRDGHFRVEARLNGRPETVLVDTGATYVAINARTARRLGLRLTPADFRHRAQTANGEMAVAIATIDRVSVGRVEVRNVQAMISEGDGLAETLLGMSFLSKLRSVEVQSNTLNLVR